MFGGDESVNLMDSPDRQPTTAYEGCGSTRVCGRNLQVHVSVVGLTIVILCKLAYELVSRRPSFDLGKRSPINNTLQTGSEETIPQSLVNGSQYIPYFKCWFTRDKPEAMLYAPCKKACGGGGGGGMVRLLQDRGYVSCKHTWRN